MLFDEICISNENVFLISVVLIGQISIVCSINMFVSIGNGMLNFIGNSFSLRELCGGLFNSLAFPLSTLVVNIADSIIVCIE